MKQSSLFIFHKDSKARNYATKVANNPYWESLIFSNLLLSKEKVLVSILANSILLILSSPLDDPDSTKSKVFLIFDRCFTILFIIKILIKIISSGFLFNWEDNRQAYIRNYWNILDAFVVIVSKE